jgi:hypothetical protein
MGAYIEQIMRLRFRNRIVYLALKNLSVAYTKTKAKTSPDAHSRDLQ